jgi:hypothetical protein
MALAVLIVKRGVAGARHVREYLSALRPLVRGEDADFHGETLTALGRMGIPGAETPSVVPAGRGPSPSTSRRRGPVS